MTKSGFKKTLLVVSIAVLASHLVYVLAGNAARAVGGAGAALTVANLSHGITCLLLMWLALLFRERCPKHPFLALLLYVVSVSALSALCVLLEAPLSTVAGGTGQVIRAMLLCWIAFLMWGAILSFLAWVRVANEAKLAAARDAALEKQQEENEQR